MLIVSSPLSDQWKDVARHAGVELIWDLPELLSRAAKTSVYERLLSFISDVGVGDQGTRGDSPSTASTTVDSSQPPVSRGEELCSRFQDIPKGGAGAIEFERICTESIKHLFGDQFGSWHEQDASEGGFHRRDFLVRLRPKHDFWTSLAHDFRTRYIVFEFKNDEEAISQDQIYSTEKYLFTTALRSVAFIVARCGADKGAYRAASGALRETGKLIMILDQNDLCEMLRASDRVGDPEILLHERLDQILTKMLR